MTLLIDSSGKIITESKEEWVSRFQMATEVILFFIDKAFEEELASMSMVVSDFIEQCYIEIEFQDFFSEEDNEEYDNKSENNEWSFIKEVFRTNISRSQDLIEFGDHEKYPKDMVLLEELITLLSAAYNIIPEKYN